MEGNIKKPLIGGLIIFRPVMKEANMFWPLGHRGSKHTVWLHLYNRHSQKDIGIVTCQVKQTQNSETMK